MRGRTILAVVVGAVLAVPLSCAGPVAGAFAAPALSPTGDGDLNTQQARIDQALATASATDQAADTRVRAAATAYALATEELPDARNALAIANGRVIAAKVALDNARTTVTATVQGSLEAAAMLAADGTRVLATRATITKLATIAYEGSGLDVSVLVPGTPEQVLDRLTLLDQFSRTTRQDVAEYVSARARAVDSLNRAYAAQRAAWAARIAAVNAVTTAQSARDAATAQLTSVNDLVTTRQAALAVAQTFRTQALALYQQFQQEIAEVTREFATDGHDEAGRTTTVSPTSGYFIMPVHGPKTSPFGMRLDPVYHRWKLHAGVDIAAADGTPIHAAASGRVIRAGWDGGYGNYTCVDNGLYQGQGIATCYAHQSKILVHTGEYVTLGQVIGLVGETGAATGYHLHFEVRINGKAINPVPWLPACWC